jgi:hypothetical protein
LWQKFRGCAEFGGVDTEQAVALFNQAQTMSFS